MSHACNSPVFAKAEMAAAFQNNLPPYMPFYDSPQGCVDSPPMPLSPMSSISAGPLHACNMHGRQLSIVSESPSLMNTVRSLGATEVEGVRWCNFLYSTRCPYHKNDSGASQCRYLHMDIFVQDEMYCDEVVMLTAPNLMEKSMKGLAKELQRCVEGWVAQNAKAGNPDSRLLVAEDLRQMGWVLEPATAAAAAEDLKAITLFLVRTLHFDCNGADPLMFRTIQYFMALGRCQAPGRPTAAPPRRRCSSAISSSAADTLMDSLDRTSRACLSPRAGSDAGSLAGSWDGGSVSPSPSFGITMEGGRFRYNPYN
eukprot:TRINITY_DN28048_c0_g1_i1.p1 TRINITY_DN28048_c0_g1~~TRINITY_DN28048_c0_g1_i1.p1  ORF type:complete len:312 (+),score=99.16 TRINITY_DN28048_c0_g1_i1:64-999(+)